MITLPALLLFVSAVCCAQGENAAIRNGNKLYRQNSFEQSLQAYKSALALSPDNPIANFNQGNAQFRTNKLDDALQSYENTITGTDKKPVKEKAFYNKGVTFSKQQKLQESIDAWKNALKLDPSDQEARENLQKALLEQKKQQQQQKQQQPEEKEKKKNDQKQEKPPQPQPQPKQPQSRLNKKQVEQLLKALAQKEKEVQDKMQLKNVSPSRQEKDW